MRRIAVGKWSLVRLRQVAAEIQRILVHWHADASAKTDAIAFKVLSSNSGIQ